tara:strand:- start:146 stop:406 length:261 start_codon:yes stop_codon:yes gene_type:complete
MSKTKTYINENVVGEFYRALADEDESRVKRVHIPRSDVFYVREKIFHDTGIRYTLDHVERAMYLEGMLKAKDVYKPHMKRIGYADI